MSSSIALYILLLLPFFLPLNPLSPKTDFLTECETYTFGRLPSWQS